MKEGALSRNSRAPISRRRCDIIKVKTVWRGDDNPKHKFWHLEHKAVRSWQTTFLNLPILQLFHGSSVQNSSEKSRRPFNVIVFGFRRDDTNHSYKTSDEWKVRRRKGEKKERDANITIEFFRENWSKESAILFQLRVGRQEFIYKLIIKKISIHRQQDSTICTIATVNEICRVTQILRYWRN